MNPTLFYWSRLGWGVVLPVLFLAAVGLATIHASERLPTSASAEDPYAAPVDVNWAERIVRGAGPLTLRQGAYFITGVGLMLLTLGPSYRRIGRFAFVIYGVVMALLLVLMIDRYVVDLPFVPLRRATRRWILIGPLQIQPSEFMKVALVLALAYYLRYRSSYRTWRGLIPPFLITLVPMLLILKQPDLGTLLMMLPVLFAMLFIAGARIRHLALIVLAGMIILPLFYHFGMRDYQKDRVRVVFKQFSHDDAWHNDQGYQLRQGLTALGNGRLTGAGLGGSPFIQKGLLPEEHNDFIFARIGNQFGLLGCTLVILAYVLIVVFGLEVALVTNDPFGRLLAVGVVAMIVVQALLNICMNIGLAPITGMPLPFISAGGSSLWANFIALGLLVNVARRRPMLIANKPFEFED